MPITIVSEGTGPVPAPVLPSPSRTVATRRKFRLAASLRRNRRRATWIRAERAGELTGFQMFVTAFGAVTLAVTLSAWMWTF